MPSFRDEIWNELDGGYRVKYDPRPLLTTLASKFDEGSYAELYENLYHQGDVGVASYAAVPSLVDCGCLDLVAAIELARHKSHNPDLPNWLESEYLSAIENIEAPVRDTELLSYFSLLALARGQYKIAQALFLVDPDEIINEYANNA